MRNIKKSFLEDPDVAPQQEGGNGPELIGLRVVRGGGMLPRTRAAGTSKYNIADLKVGDWLVSDQLKHIRNATVAARSYAKRVAASGEAAPKFVTRKTPQGEYALVRES